MKEGNHIVIPFRPKVRGGETVPQVEQKKKKQSTLKTAMDLVQEHDPAIPQTTKRFSMRQRYRGNWRMLRTSAGREMYNKVLAIKYLRAETASKKEQSKPNRENEKAPRTRQKETLVASFKNRKRLRKESAATGINLGMFVPETPKQEIDSKLKKELRNRPFTVFDAGKNKTKEKQAA